MQCLNLLETPAGGNIFIDGIDILDKSTGLPINPPEDRALGDPIGLNILRNRCKTLNYNYKNGRNTFIMEIRVYPANVYNLLLSNEQRL